MKATGRPSIFSDQEWMSHEWRTADISLFSGANKVKRLPKELKICSLCGLQRASFIINGTRRYFTKEGKALGGHTIECKYIKNR